MSGRYKGISGELCPICKAGGKIDTVLDGNGHCPRDVGPEEHGAEFIDRCSGDPASMEAFEIFHKFNVSTT